MTFKRTQERGRRRRRIQQQRHESLLRFARKPDNFQFSDGLLSGLLCGGNYKIADRAALNFRSAANDGEGLACNACLHAGGSAMSLRFHVSFFYLLILYVISTYM